jgi:hypothetical protein
MKKLLTICAAAVTSFACAFGITACNDGGESEKVTLVSINATQVGVSTDIDYYVVPEPAASAKTNAIASLNFVGDLQQLYGGTNGYPQAVIVAKNSLCTGSNFITSFLSAVEDNKAWLISESTTSTQIVSAVQSHLTDGMTATFNANNLTKSVISNCGISLTYASDCKQEIINFMQKLNGVSQTSFGTPSDNFFFDGNAGTSEYSGTVSVYAPDGAPALGLASLMAGEVSFSAQVDYHVVDATTIQTYVTGANPAADICVLPVNLATKLLGSGDNYKIVATLTHGNLYLLGSGDGQITSQNLSSLKGKRVGVINLAQVPGLTFKLILKDNNIEYTEEQ